MGMAVKTANERFVVVGGGKGGENRVLSHHLPKLAPNVVASRDLAEYVQ
jgi:hypothetical protein